jgi:MHS family proline/betaine transporter-like MFS transporter
MTFTEYTLKRSHAEALTLNFMAMSILLVVAPFSAWLTDYVGRRKVLMFTALTFLIIAYPVFMLMQMPELSMIFLGQALFALVVAFYIGPVPALLVEIFPTRVRYTGMSLSYNISAAVFGGTAPIVCQWLITETQNVYSISYYVMACAMVSLAALYFYKDRHDMPLA